MIANCAKLANDTEVRKRAANGRHFSPGMGGLSCNVFIHTVIDVFSFRVCLLVLLHVWSHDQEVIKRNCLLVFQHRAEPPANITENM